jgi:hypothetical protein
MRLTDLARLNAPYPEDTDPPEAAAMAALGMELPHWTTLETDIFADFTEQPPYGIGWWAPGSGTSRRILIADQLYCCTASVAGNITEAALHWLEFLDAAERDGARFADAVQIENGRPTISAPRPRSPLDQLAPELVRVHYAGIVRALASALDCLGGVVIGVAALPMSILWAGFDRARNNLNRIAGAANDGEKMQAQFAALLEAGIAAAGPPGWSNGPSTSATCWSIADEDSNTVSSCREVRFCTEPTHRDCCGHAASRTFPVTPAGPTSRYSSIPPGRWC